QMTLSHSDNPALITTFVGRANGNQVFHGVSAPEVEVQLSDNLSGLALDTKAYGILDPASGLVTNFGTLTDTQITIAGQLSESVTDAVYSPVFVDQRYTLSAGQSITQTWTQALTTTPIVNGTPGTPMNSSVTETVTTIFAGNERVT